MKIGILVFRCRLGLAIRIGDLGFWIWISGERVMGLGIGDWGLVIGN